MKILLHRFLSVHSSSTRKEHMSKIPPPFVFFFFVSSKLTACLIYLGREQKHIDRGTERKRGESWHRGQAQTRAFTSTLPTRSARTPNRGIPAPVLAGALTPLIMSCKTQSGPGKTRHGVSKKFFASTAEPQIKLSAPCGVTSSSSSDRLEGPKKSNR